MSHLQLSLFAQEQQSTKKQKKAKLGRYERIQRELLTTKRDPHQVYIEVSSLPDTLELLGNKPKNP
jgi:DNA (cytosine-5)-methyltransferase 1